MQSMEKTRSEVHSLLIEFEKSIKRNKQQIVGASFTPHVMAIQSGRVQKNKPQGKAKGKDKVSMNNMIYFNAITVNGIYEIDIHDSTLPIGNSMYSISNKRTKPNLDSSYLWHCRLAHINKKRIDKLQHDGLLKPMANEPFDSMRILYICRYGYVYILKHKHEVFETFKVFKNEVEYQLGKTIKAIRSDRGGEYISQEFKDYLKAYGIVQQLTPP
ncbi:retrotransposon protein, putative, ty1-copia subclass [Tanacetum coccineum]